MTASLELAGYRAVLSQRARTFRLAAIALPSGSRDAAAALYAFCRAADDAADEALDPVVAHRELDALERGIAGDDGPAVARVVLELHREHGLSLQAARGLIAGVRSDIGEVRIADDADLLGYAYLVAGTVGVMMCPLLDVRSATAQQHASDLGMAMQITNICRDVAEDARRGRVYLPSERLRGAGIQPEQVLDGTADRAALRVVIRSLLQRADNLYESGERGIPFLPPRARLAVLIASRLYRAIGLELLRQGGDPFRRRAVVPPLSKLWWALAALVAWLGTFVPRRVRSLAPRRSRVR
jgi:15-cis-phytoene synthase